MARPFGNKRHSRRDNRPSQQIRRINSFGKFEGGTILTVAAYDIAMYSNYIESYEGSGSYTRVDGPFTNEYLKGVFYSISAYTNTARLNRAERRKLRSYVGLIVRESDQGFVSATFYTNNKQFEKHWSGIEKEFSEETIDDDPYIGF